MTRSVAGLFPDGESAERAIVALKEAGFDPSHIGVVMRDVRQAPEIAEQQGTATTEGAVAGGLLGGTIGAALAATGAFVVPGIGPFISGGILATCLVGGTAGGLIGGLIGLGIPRDEAQYYEDRVHQGGTLVTVVAQRREAEAQAILRDNGAEDVQHRDFTASYGRNPSPAADGDGDTTAAEATTGASTADQAGLTTARARPTGSASQRGAGKRAHPDDRSQT